MIFCLSVDLLKHIDIHLVWIITMIGSFLSLVDSAVSRDLSSRVIMSFRYYFRTMMSSGFWSSWSTYCFRFSLYCFCFWSLDSICSAVVSKTAPKSYTYSLKFLIDDVYAGRFNCPPLPQFHLLPILPTQPRRPRSWPWPPLPVLDLLLVS